MGEAPPERPDPAPPGAPPFVHPPLEAALLVALAVGVALGLRGLSAAVPALAGATGLGLVLACVVPAYVLALRRGRDPLLVHGILVRPQRPWRLAAVSLALLGGFALAIELAARSRGWAPQPLSAGALLARLGNDLVTVALAEEYLFRGVAQPAWEPAEPRWRVLGVPFGRGALRAALAFGLAHPLVWLAPAQAVVVLPGLWFAWLRAAGGSVLVCALAHALANTLQLGCLTRYPELPSLLPWVG
ncbi:MAG: CPBP family intramembrane glutamic endopeptidase [Planctomycetota bacterium]